MSLSESPNRQAYREFNEPRCAVCGGHKIRGQAFCRACYLSLPEVSRKGLWRRFGAGYEESYFTCKEWLSEERRATE